MGRFWFSFSCLKLLFFFVLTIFVFEGALFGPGNPNNYGRDLAKYLVG